MKHERAQRSSSMHHAPPGSRPSDGQELDSEVRTSLEPRFGHSFSNVRIFADHHADRLAERFDADAFTVGSDVYFANNRFNPRDEDGMDLLEHELTHVAQNERFGVNNTRWLSDPASQAEREASGVGRGVPLSNHGVQTPSAAFVQRQNRGRRGSGSRRTHPLALREDVAAGRFPSGDAARVVSVHTGELISALQSARWPGYLPSNWAGWNTINNLQRTLMTNLAQITNGGMAVTLPDHEESFPGGTFHSHMNLRARMTNIREVGRDGVRIGTESHVETGSGSTRSSSEETEVGAEAGHSGATGSVGHTSARGREDTASDSHSHETTGAAERTGMFAFDLEFEVELWQSFDVGTGTSVVNTIGNMFGGDDHAGMLRHSAVPVQTIVTESLGNMARLPLSSARH
jgi:hypothetical protein